MIKKDYLKPAMIVVQLQHKNPILAASTTEPTRTLSGSQGDDSDPENVVEDTWYEFQ